MNIHDVKQIPVFDLQKAKQMTLNLKMVTGDTIASATIDLGPFYAAPAKFVNAKHFIDFTLADTLKSKEKGQLKLKMRFLLKKPKDFEEKKKETIEKKGISPEKVAKEVSPEKAKEEEKKSVSISQKMPKKQTKAEDDFE